MNSHPLSEVTLIQKIKTAFPQAFQAYRMTHSECVQLRPRLIAIRAEDFEEAFAQVLLDLVETHTGKAGQSENAEEVVRFLDVQDDPSGLEILPGYDIEQEQEMTRILQEAKVRSLAHVSKEQAEVLVAWLNAAKDWPDLAWYRDEIQSALAYWQKRAA
jgi:hypothetical protein